MINHAIHFWAESLSLDTWVSAESSYEAFEIDESRLCSRFLVVDSVDSTENKGGGVALLVKPNKWLRSEW
jgi:hypothetical protein